MKVREFVDYNNLCRVLHYLAQTSIKHPGEMSDELRLFFSGWFGQTIPPKGTRFEQHSHTHFSNPYESADLVELADVVDLLFANKTHLWSLTDHQNSNGFDSLRDGSYRLSPEYELEFHKRYMIIHKEEQELVLLRSIELQTHEGEMGIHGYEGSFPEEQIPMAEAINRAKDNGGYVIVNHPFFWRGIGFKSRKNIEEAVALGVCAIEKNGFAAPPFIYGPVLSEIVAEELNVPLVASGDAHLMCMYGLSGVVFQDQTYLQALAQNSHNHADAIKDLIKTGEFSNYFSYVRPADILKFLRKVFTA